MACVHAIIDRVPKQWVVGAHCIAVAHHSTDPVVFTPNVLTVCVLFFGRYDPCSQQTVFFSINFLACRQRVFWVYMKRSFHLLAQVAACCFPMATAPF